jgi:PAS domain S-box-containing protein
MSVRGPVNILLVDDQPAKLLSYEVILSELGDNLIKAHSAREALTHLLKTEVAVVLIDVCMPELDGYELASMIRQHPRHEQTAIIFVSAIQVTELDSLRGYQAGAVDYVPVPVVPEVLRAKVRVFAELYRKTRQLERLNAELEQRVAERTAALEASAARLLESEQRRSLALAAGRMGSWEWDILADRYSWDDGQFRLFGLEPQSAHLEAARVNALLHPEDAEQVRRSAAKAAATGGAYDAEFRIRRPDGEIRWCVSSGAATLDEHGRPIRLSGVTHDITERKLAEEALQQLNEQLEQRIAARTREHETALAQLFEAQKIDTIGQLTGGVAHDFNNLLMVVLGSLELLKKRLPEGDARSHRLVDNAVTGARRGAALTQRLLAFARRQDLKPEAIDVPQLISGMEDLLTRALGPGVLITKDFPAHLPPVLVDANQLELAILNLSVNARDAMPLGGSLSILACEERVGPDRTDAPKGLPEGDYVRIDVIDTGMGMDADTLARATEPFFTTKGPGKGTGLGLSMVHGLAAQSGGAMTVQSTVGEGTTIALWLPRADQHEQLIAIDPSAELAPMGRDDMAPELRILVVDDDPLVSTGTAAMLDDLGHSVIEVSSGPQALEVLRETAGNIHLVITDHAMPGMTGLELARRIQDEHPSLAVILASGFADITGAPDFGALPRLAKPFSQLELASVIAVTMGHGTGARANVVALRNSKTHA